MRIQQTQEQTWEEMPPEQKKLRDCRIRTLQTKGETPPDHEVQTENAHPTIGQIIQDKATGHKGTERQTPQDNNNHDEETTLWEHLGQMKKTTTHTQKKKTKHTNIQYGNAQ